jgi:predicted metalloenzyme YecM
MGMDGLGVAGMMKLIVSQWIIRENSLRLAPVSQKYRKFSNKHEDSSHLSNPTCALTSKHAVFFLQPKSYEDFVATSARVDSSRVMTCYPA